MADEEEYGDYGDGGERRSNLYLDPRSHLGLNFNKSRSELLALALSHSVGYYNLRQDVTTAISEQSILAIYDKIWSILGKGIVHLDDRTEIQLVYTDKEGDQHRYNPNLPEVKISKLAMSVAEQMLSTSNAIVDEILHIKDYRRNCLKDSGYISNGEFIVAMILNGYDFRKYDDSINCSFKAGYLPKQKLPKDFKIN